MAGQSWSINIVSSASGVAFNPDVFGVAPGSPLQAQKGDLVCWNNQTDNPHQLVVGSGDTAETFDVTPWSSTNAYLIQTAAPATITYSCDGSETGNIEVVK